MDIDEVFKILGFGRMHIVLFIGCVLLQVWIANEQLGVSIVLVAATCELEMTAVRLSWLLAFNFFSQLVFCFYWGSLADTLGRRKIMLFGASIANFCSFVSALMPSFWYFLFFRFVSGGFIASPTTCLAAYLGEFQNTQRRVKVLNFLSYGIGASMISVPVLSMYILPLDLELLHSWRILLMVNQLPGMFAMIIIFYMPESPKFYLSIGEDEKAMQVLEKCCRQNKGADVTLASLGIDSVTQPHLRPVEARRSSGARVTRFHDTKILLVEHWRVMTIALISLALICGVGFGLLIWLLRIRVGMMATPEEETVCEYVAAVGPKETELTCEITTEQLMDPLIHGFCVLGAFITTSFLLLCIGRRVVIIAYCFATIVSLFLVNFVNKDQIVMFLFYGITDPSMCNMRLLGTVIIDLIPTHLRGKAVSLGNMAGRTGILVTSQYVGYVMVWNCYVAFNTFLFTTLVAMILIAILPSERKD